MRTLFATALIAIVCFIVSAQPAMSQLPIGPNIGIGLEYDNVTGDTDNGIGAYAYYEIPLTGPLSALLELNYVTGDFDIPAGKGSYTSIGLGAAFMISGQTGEWTPYAGVGGDNHFNDFEDINYGNKLSLFCFGGAKRPIGDGINFDISLRYRTLRVGSIDEKILPNPINMDAIVIRSGVVFEF